MLASQKQLGISYHRVGCTGRPFSTQSRAVPRIACQAHRPDGAERLAALPLACLAAASAFLLPLAADAVSGGGGLGGSLSYQDLSGKDFHNVKLYKADLRGTNFSGANMQNANLFGAFAKDAQFKGADMSFTDLESVDFDNADLTDAVLQGAQVTNARFNKSVKIEGSDWTDVILRKDVQRQLCALASGTNPKTGVATRDSLMC